MSFILNTPIHRSRTPFDKSTSQATAQYEVIAADVTAGLGIPATSATTRSEVLGVSTDTITSGDALPQGAVWQIFENDTYIADTTNNSDAGDNYQYMVLTNSKVVNNTGTHNANGIVQQMAVYGSPSEKKIIVRFV